MAIDWTKPIETDELKPKEVRVICTDFGDSSTTYRVVVGIKDHDGNWGWALNYDHNGDGPVKSPRLRNVVASEWRLM